MAIKQGGTIVIDDSRNIVNSTIMMNGEYTPYSGQGPNIAWSAAGGLVSTFNNPNAYNTSLNDQFGQIVATSGNYAIVCAYFEDDIYGTSSGKAYIFNVTTGALLFTLNNPNPFSTSTDDSFGYSVAISGNYAVIGAPNEDDSGGSGSGKAYIFNVTTGALLWTLNDPNAYGTSAGDSFGGSVSISGDYAIIGAVGEDDSGGTSSGKAYIYNVTTGALLFTLNNPNAYDTSAGDNFGVSVAISGNYAIVGAYSEADGPTGFLSGKAYIFNVTTGALLFTLNNPNVYGTSASDYFGIKVGISGNYAIISATGEKDANSGGADSGKAYIFNVTTGALLFTLNNPNAYSTSAGDYFGFSVAISGNYAIVGAYAEDDVGGGFSGKAYIYNVTTGALLFTLNNPNAYSTIVNDGFGISVSISDNYAIVGAYGEDDVGGTDSGKTYTFALNTTYRTGKPITTAGDFGYVRKSAAGALKWTLDNPNAYGTSALDQFAYSVAISGNYAIVGTYSEDDAGGLDSGKAYIFNVTTGALLFTLNNPNAFSTSANDTFGFSVAISGNYAVVGAHPEDDAGGANSGKAYIFNVTTGALLFTLNNPNAYSTSVSDWFGYSVAISGNYAIVGAVQEGDAGGGGSGKAYIFNVTTGTLLWTLNNPNAFGTSAGDAFGVSVSISGNYAIVGAIAEDDTGGTTSGKAYIFNVTTGALFLTLNNPNAYDISSGDQFGFSVAISGNYAIVGANLENDIGGTFSGKAYIFNATTGALLFTLNNPNAYSTSLEDFFGCSVAISGNYAIVGAIEEDDAGGSRSGKAYIFNVSTGALLFTLNNPNAYDTSAFDYFGWSVAISSNYAIVGAYNEDDAGGAESGKAYIFSVNDVYKLTNVEEIQLANGMKISADNKLLQQSVPGGALLKTLDNPNAYGTSADDRFGFSVAISDNYAIVSAYGEDDAGGTSSGKAYIFNVTTGALLFTLNNPNAFSTSVLDFFGWSVAISGNYAIVGALQEDDAGGVVSGKAYIFNVTTGALLFTLNDPNAFGTSASDSFGYSVAISGNYAIVGTDSEDDSGGADSGKAYIFNVTTGALLFTLNNPNAYGTSASDYFGYSVAVSGNYAIVGAQFEDDAGGLSSGKAYIYNVTTGALLFTLNNPNAYSTSANDQFGISVAISGNYAVVGAWNEDDIGGVDSGKVYIYNVTTGALLFTLNNPNAFFTSDGDQFGYSVAISGNYAIVSAYAEDDAGGVTSGKAYIFNVTTGTLLWTLNNPNAFSTSTSDEFGTSVAISGNYAIVGAQFEDDAGGGLSGKAYIFSVRDLTYLDRLVQMVS